jgi:hypothetical protein
MAATVWMLVSSAAMTAYGFGWITQTDASLIGAAAVGYVAARIVDIVSLLRRSEGS